MQDYIFIDHLKPYIHRNPEGSVTCVFFADEDGQIITDENAELREGYHIIEGYKFNGRIFISADLIDAFGTVAGSKVAYTRRMVSYADGEWTDYEQKKHFEKAFLYVRRKMREAQ